MCFNVGDSIYFTQFPKLISISALLFSYRNLEVGGHPRRELNVVTRAVCSTLILFGGPGETKSNHTIEEITVKRKKKETKKKKKKTTT